MKKITKPTLIIVRHGSTSMNTKGEEKLRGWRNPPLDDLGKKQADKAADIVSQYPVSHIYSGDLARTHDTAKAISKKTGAAITTTKALRPWNYGELTGKPVNAENLAKLQEYQEKPDKKVPNGESYNSFVRDRFSPAVQKLKRLAEGIPGKAVVAVTHSRNLYPLRRVLGDHMAPVKVHDPEYGPGSVWKAEFDDDGFKMERMK